MVLLPANTESDLAGFGMTSVNRVLNFSAFLIVNRNSWETKNLGEVMASIHDKLPEEEKKTHLKEEVGNSGIMAPYSVEFMEDNDVRLALPDGHQQQPMVELLNKSGIQIDDYPSATGNRRPRVKLEGVSAKVIRPQDMPLQVANGNFDLAITGRDWLREHLYQFPSSPVQELLNLGLGKVRLVAVVSQELNVNSPGDLQKMVAEKGKPLRMASEYVNIADKYARENHIGHYMVIPTWGATEAFLPDDADLLIENTETGRTIARHNLKIIDTLFESTACLIGNTNNKYSTGKNKLMETIVNMLRVAVEGA
jgi:ATP phosphoribosyltransferase